MDLIIAGTNPLATDMTAAYTMKFKPEESSTFSFAWRTGIAPKSLDEMEIRRTPLSSVKKEIHSAKNLSMGCH